MNRMFPRSFSCSQISSKLCDFKNFKYGTSVSFACALLSVIADSSLKLSSKNTKKQWFSIAKRSVFLKVWQLRERMVRRSDIDPDSAYRQSRMTCPWNKQPSSLKSFVNDIMCRDFDFASLDWSEWLPIMMICGLTPFSEL